MSKFASFIEKERRYTTESIRFQGLKIWTYLRVYAFDIYLRKQSSQQKVGVRSFRRVVGNLFWGFPTKRTYSDIVFSSSDQRKLINGKWMDRLDSSAEMRNQALFVELPNPSHKKRSLVASRNVLSKGWLYLFEKLVSFFIFDIKVEQVGELNRIFGELEISINTKQLLKSFKAQYYVSKCFFKWFKAKRLYTTTHYTNMGRIHAAKDMGLHVVEVQHGLISEFHIAYNLVKTPERAILPDRIFVFGQRDEKILLSAGFLQKESISIIGSHYLDYIYSKNYDKYSSPGITFCFTAQDIEIPDTITWLNELLQKFENASFFFIPRRLSIESYYKQGLSQRWVSNDENTYITMAKSSIHLTLYSTCALEAIALHTPTVLFNISGHARLHFGEEIHFLKNMHCLDTVEELRAFDFQSICDENSRRTTEGDWLYKRSYESNLSKALMNLK